MENPIIRGRKLYCKYRGEVIVNTADDKCFTVIKGSKEYVQTYNEVGRIIYFDKGHENLNKDELAHYKEYVYFFPELQALHSNLSYIEEQQKIVHDKEQIQLEAKRKKNFISNSSGNQLKNADKVYVEEATYLNKVLSIIDEQIDQFKEKYSDIMRDRHFYHSPTVEELADYQYETRLAMQTKKDLLTLESKRESPYFARMDFKISSKNGKSKETVYIGNSSISTSGRYHVYDWRSEIGKLYYIKNQIHFKYESYDYELRLRRALEIQNMNLIKYYDEYVAGKDLFKDGVSDPFLIEILNQKRGQQRLTDIIKTIQENQNDIIRENYDQNIIVQGCAGSGKTMILLHRLSYILFNNKSLSNETIKIITPNSIFGNHINELARELEVDEIWRGTIIEYYILKLTEYRFKDSKFTKAVIYNEKVLSDQLVGYFYSDNYLSCLNKAYLEWHNKILKEANALGIYEIAERLGIEFYKGKTNSDFVNGIKALITKLLYSNEKNIAIAEKLLIELRKIENTKTSEENKVVEILSLIQGYESRYESEIAESNHQLEIVKMKQEEISSMIAIGLEKISSLENQMTSINDKILITNKSISSVDEIFEAEFITIEDKIRNNKIELSRCGILSFGKKKTLKELGIQIERERDQLLQRKNSNELELKKKPLIIDLEMYKEISSTLAEDYKRQLQEIDVLNERVLNYDREEQDIKTKLDELTPDLNRLRDAYADKLSIIERKNEDIQKINNDYNEVKDIIIDSGKLSQLQQYLKTLPSEVGFVLDEIYMPLRKEVFEKYGQEHDSRMYRFDLFSIVGLAYIYIGACLKKDFYFYIDEGQDLSLSEYRLLKAINGDSSVFNVYGDTNQLIKNGVGSETWDGLIKYLNAKKFVLNENYRNTVEITDYCNRKLNYMTQPIGISGAAVKEFKLSEIDLENILNKFIKNSVIFLRKAIIIKDTNTLVFKQIKGMLNKNNLDLILSDSDEISNEKINVLTVEMVKGLEFESVIVITEGMSRNERYISYTRALDDLTIIDV